MINLNTWKIPIYHFHCSDVFILIYFSVVPGYTIVSLFFPLLARASRSCRPSFLRYIKSLITSLVQKTKYAIREFPPTLPHEMKFDEVNPFVWLFIHTKPPKSPTLSFINYNYCCLPQSLIFKGPILQIFNT